MDNEVSRAERNIIWIEKYCVVPDGMLVGEPLRLLPFQKKFLIAIYDNKVGTRTAILSVPRKNGKTGLAACLVLLHLVGPESQRNSEIYSAAQSKEQASITYHAARKMIEMSPALSAVVSIKSTYKELHCKELGTEYKALSSDAKTKYGLKPILIIHDELGQVEKETYDLYQIALG